MTEKSSPQIKIPHLASADDSLLSQYDSVRVQADAVESQLNFEVLGEEVAFLLDEDPVESQLNFEVLGEEAAFLLDEDSVESQLNFKVLGEEVALLVDEQSVSFDCEAMGKEVARAAGNVHSALPVTATAPVRMAPLVDSTSPVSLVAEQPANFQTDGSQAEFDAREIRRMKPRWMPGAWALGFAAAACIGVYFGVSARDGVHDTQVVAAVRVPDAVEQAQEEPAVETKRGDREIRDDHELPGVDLPVDALDENATELVAVRDPRRVAFKEGSVLDLGAGAKLEILERSDSTVRLNALSGRTVFSVNPERRRSWQIQVGEYQVSVTGTVFAIDRQLESSLVEVTRGQVIVAGGALGESIQRLNKGENLELVHAEETPPSRGGFRGLTGRRLVASKTKGGKTVRSDTWQWLLREQRYAEAMSAARKSGVSNILERGSASQLSDLADVARLSGNSGVAQQAWRQLRKRHASSPKARRAAFHLGRSAAAVGNGATATRWFEAYLRESPGGTYVGQVRGRLIQLYRDSGAQGRARRQAEAYLKRFPNGNYSRVARSVLKR